MDAYIFDENGVPEKLWNGKRIQDFTLEDKLKFIVETDITNIGKISDTTAELLDSEGYIYKNGNLINQKNVAEIEAAEKLKLLEVFVKNDIGLYGTVQENTLKSIQNQGYTVIDGHIIKDEQTHLETPVIIAPESLKSTLVINAFGGPGAGKSTAALDIVSALKKRGLVAEYVSEYAKELVWQNRLDLLDGTEAHQRMILQEQYNRVERLIGKCDIIVTDSPILLNMNYNKELTPAYEEEVKQLYDKFTNFAFVVQRDSSKFEQEGRVHNLEESEALDKNITDMLDKYNIKYGTYNHATIDKVVYNAAKVYYGILNSSKSIDQKTEVKEAAKYNKEKYLQQQEEKLAKVNLQIKEMSINYETHPEQIAELLAFSSKFYNYSARNILLINNQNPYATFVQSFDQWKEAGYPVKKGQQGLKVLVPVKTTYLEVPGESKLVKLSDATPEQQRLYKTHQIEGVQKTYYSIGNVFDISQTSCPVSEYPQYYSMGYKDADQDRLIEGIENYCKDSLKMPVNISELSSIGLRGYYDETSKAITLNELLESTEKLSTLTHELGHAVMDHTAFTEVSNRSQQEFEADCFSVMLDNHLGIDVTEARKRHLADNYSKMEKNYLDRDANYDFDKIISDVFSRYKKVIVDMDVYINNQIEADKKKEECLEENVIEDVDIDKYMDVAENGIVTRNNYVQYFDNTQEEPYLPHGWTYLIHGTNLSQWNKETLNSNSFIVKGIESGLYCVERDNAIENIKSGGDVSKLHSNLKNIAGEKNCEIRCLIYKDLRRKKDHDEYLGKLNEEEIKNVNNFHIKKPYYPAIPNKTNLIKIATSEYDNLTKESKIILWYVPEQFLEHYKNDCEMIINKEMKEDTTVSENVDIDKYMDAAGTAIFDKMVEKAYPADIDFNAFSQLELA